MQKWDYLYVLRDREFDINHKIGNWNISFYPPQEQMGNKPSEFLPILGEQGWELVSVWALSDISGEAWAGYSSQEKWAFKRPKQG
jgi:hypothetical protein